jgi:hypothetical protein
MLPMFTTGRQPGRESRAAWMRCTPVTTARFDVSHSAPVAAVRAALTLAPRLQPGPQAEIKVGFLERLFVVAQGRLVRRQRYGKS